MHPYVFSNCQVQLNSLKVIIGHLKKEENMPKEGSKAPAFCLPSADKDKVCLKDFYGKWVVLYFYPKDSTSG